MTRGRRLALLVAVLWLALALHLLTLRQLAAHSPFIMTIPPGVDQHYYLAHAREFAVGTWPQPGAAFDLAPYESLWLGGLFRWLDGDQPGLFLPRLLQTLIGLLLVALAYRLGRWSFPSRGGVTVGIGAALLLALYGPLIFYNLELTTAPHTTLWVTLTLVLTLAYERFHGWPYPLLAGLALGMATAARPNALILGGGIVLWFLLVKLPRRRVLWGTLLLGIGALLPLLGPVLWNTAQTGRLTFVTTTGPYNLYVGNNPEATGVFRAIPEAIKLQALAGDFSYTAAVADFIRSEPGNFLRLLGQKAVMFLVASDMELGSNVNYAFWGVDYAGVLRLLQPLRFELLTLLALFGLILLRGVRSRLLYFAGAVYLLGTIPFFVQARFRMALVPALAVLAVATVLEMVRRYRRGERRVLVLVLALLVAYLAIVARYAYLLSGGVQIVS